jgi:hypothetical protein
MGTGDTAAGAGSDDTRGRLLGDPARAVRIAADIEEVAQAELQAMPDEASIP